MRWFLVLLALLAAALAGVVFGVPSNAATVNGVPITQSHLRSDLGTISKSPGYQCIAISSRTQAGQSPFTTSYVGAGGSSMVPSQIAAWWLTQLIQDQVIIQQADRARIDVTRGDLSIGRSFYSSELNATLANVESSGYNCGSSTQSLLSSLNSNFVRAQVYAQTELYLLMAHAIGYGLSSQSASKYYLAHRAMFDTVCASEISVANSTQLKSVEKTLATSTPFDQAAPAGSITSGCLQPGQSPTLSVELENIDVGQVTQAIPTGQGGYIILQVTKRTPNPLTGLDTAIRQIILLTGAQRIQPLLQRALQTASVSVNPAYGSWSKSKDVIIRPLLPSQNLVPNPSANSPQAPSSSVSPFSSGLSSVSSQGG